MASPSAGASPAARRLGVGRRSALILLGVLGILCTSLPAQAAPATAADAARIVAAKAHQLEVLTEKVNTAQVMLTREQAAVQAATATAAKATAVLAVAQREVRGIARSAFTGDSVSPFRAMMTSKNATEFITKVSTLETIAGHQDGVLHTAAVASLTASRARAAAQKAAAAAKAQFDALAGQQAALKKDIAKFQAQYDQLSAAEKLAAVGDTGPASRAGRTAPAVVTGPIVASSQAAQIAVDTAMAQRGKPYVWAASGPGSFDCSGLMMYAYAAAGIGLPHSSFLQSQMGQAVSRDQLRPGDLVFFYSPVSHVGMYIGNGLMVNAPTAGDVVKVASIDAMGYYAGARRIAG